MAWTTADARRQYNIPGWSAGYVDVGDAGQLLVRPTGQADGPAVDLQALATRVREAGLTWPVLVRFTDILHSQIDRRISLFGLSNSVRVFPACIWQFRPTFEPWFRTFLCAHLGN